VIRRFGPPEVLAAETVPDPAPAAGQVVIEVEYASVTFVDTQIRAGRPPNPAMTQSLPLIPGNGVAGHVVQAGPGVDPGLVGRAVVSTTGGSGGYAERASVDANLAIAIPTSVSIRDAVALLADGRTALALLRAAGVASGDTVLVEAAAGGVGTCLIQLARAAGATVVACAGSPSKLPVTERLGAALAIDYSRPGWEQLIRDRFASVDVVFDGVGGTIGETALHLLGPDGRLCRYGMASGSYTDTANVGPGVEIVDGTRLSPEQSRQLSIDALELAASRQLAATIGQEYALESAAAAHGAIEARKTIGKTLLHVAPGQRRTTVSTARVGVDTSGRRGSFDRVGVGGAPADGSSESRLRRGPRELGS
jgi:NADPH2:quinone reductase